MPSEDADHAVVLTRVSSEPLAALLVGQLRSEGIRAEMSGVLTSAFRAEAPGGVQILVLAKDLGRAREVLADWNEAGS